VLADDLVLFHIFLGRPRLEGRETGKKGGREGDLGAGTRHLPPPFSFYAVFLGSSPHPSFLPHLPTSLHPSLPFALLSQAA
jgi:hypothetical protein